MNTYDKTVPYFYIIRNKETGIMYAGSRWAQGCHPDKFMGDNGYITSSPTIQSIIKEHGLDTFEILRVDTYCDGLHPYGYETLFLQTNDCAKSVDWYNGHNNNMKSCYGTTEFKQKMLSKYGFDHNSKIPEIKIKKIKTLLENYGVTHPTKSEKIKEKIKKTCNEKYGFENPTKNEKVKEKIRNTKKEKNMSRKIWC